MAGGKRTAADLGAHICFEDEAGQGLRPPKGLTWAPRGARPVVRVRGRNRGRVNIAGVVCYRTGHRSRWTLEETVTEGDTVVARFTMRGTHDGDFFGIPASGNKISVQAMNFYYLPDGRIVGERGQPDLLGVMQQIGALPAP
ncbi:ester cyclase [Streptomyces canus]|nr:ester cyclase [Streptomyces canus]MCX5254946.1 ester cyclase [Streptomyces canus]